MNKVLKQAMRGKFSRKELEESLVHRHGYELLGKHTHPKGEVWVAETFKNDDPKTFPWGYYQGMFMIGQGDDGIDGIQEVMFDAFHDPEIPQKDRKRARRNRLIQDGIAAIETQVKAGRY